MSHPFHSQIFVSKICPLLLFLIFCSAGSQAETPPRLSNLTGNFERELSRAITPLDQKYLTALTSLQRDYSKSGELNSALAIKNEIERVKEGQQLEEPKENDAKMATTPKLTKLKDSYRKAVLRKTTPILARYKKELSSLQETFTASNDLESAVAVRDRLKELEADSITAVVRKSTDGEDPSKKTTPLRRDSPLADWLQEHELFWTGNSGDAVIKFEGSMAKVFGNGKEIMERPFKVTDDNTIEFDWSKGDINTFIIDEKRTSFLRRSSKSNIAMQGDIRKR
ncbi:hypothetical protein VSU19_13370 [Verrucomicrobiales bacterium BCK34]|nr:hypothetical protein [Verrucomicrobiales bacterium BCK34]